MKKLVIGILFLGVLVMGYFTYNAVCDNKHVKNKINILSDNILKSNQEKEVYDSKMKELDEIKEKNGDKAIKYEEVEAWNQEIIEYLD